MLLRPDRSRKSVSDACRDGKDFPIDGCLVCVVWSPLFGLRCLVCAVASFCYRPRSCCQARGVCLQHLVVRHTRPTMGNSRRPSFCSLSATILWFGVGATMTVAGSGCSSSAPTESGGSGGAQGSSGGS